MSLCKLKMLEAPGSQGLILVADGQGHVTVSARNITELDSGSGGSADTHTVSATASDQLPGFLEDKVDSDTIRVVSDKLTVSPNVFAPYAHLSDTSSHVALNERATWNAKQDALGYIPENSAQKSLPNGYASLDENGKVPLNQLPSAASGSSDVVYVASAGEVIDQYAPVFVAFDGKVYMATNTDVASMHRVCGVATNAATMNQPVTILRMGTISSPMWAFTDAPAFVGNKLITQTVPTTGYTLVVGVPVGMTTLLVKIETPVLL